MPGTHSILQDVVPPVISNGMTLLVFLAANGQNILIGTKIWMIFSKKKLNPYPNRYQFSEENKV
jgi:hypothetical protein